jgi:hypothetical protein
MKKIKYILAVLGIIGSTSWALLPLTVSAYDPCAGDTTNSLVCQDQKSVPEIIKTVVNTILYILGALAVIMVIYSGFMYITSGGDANNVTKAKNTLMYSVIGLVVAVLAWSIVNFALKLFS